MSNQYYVYILQCSDGSYYTGVTNDCERRLQEHQRGVDVSAYTFSRRPVQLVYEAVFDDVWEAIRWEKIVKPWNRAKKVALIHKNQAALEAAARKKFAAKKKRISASLRFRIRGITRHDMFDLLFTAPACHPE